MHNDDHSLGDERTLNGGENRFDSQSLGDEKTFISDKHDTLGEVENSSFGVREDLSKRYTIESTLGTGGMGEVLLATDTRLGRKVALKRILGKASQNKKVINRFITEAKAVASVQHPNIVNIYDFGLATDGPYLTMEYVEGSSLEEICRKGPLELEGAVSICCQLCEGLARAHSANIIHRDIKPANVLLTPDGIPKLTDFGLAKDHAADNGMTMAGTVLGTLDFMPPEQRKDAALTDGRSDLWSLAATLYQMVTGERPRVIDLDLVPQHLRKTIAQALKSNKEDRFQTASQLRAALVSSLEVSKQVNRTTVLVSGECPKCHTQNESSRKFCRNVECGNSLTASCFSCRMALPVWEAVCGECGCNQQASVIDLIAQRNEFRNTATEYLAAGKFIEAERLRVELSGEKDSRLQQLAKWIDTFKSEIERRQEDEARRLQALINEAFSLEAKGNLAAAIELLREIPEHLRQSPIGDDAGVIEDTLKRLEQAKEEIAVLTTEVSAQAKEGDFAGLLEKIDRLAALDPNNKNVLELRPMVTAELAKRQKLLFALEKQTKESHEKIHHRVNQFLADGNLKAARTEAWGFNPEFLSAEQREIKERIESSSIWEQKLFDAFDQFLGNVGGVANQGLHEAKALKKDAYYFLKEIPGHQLIRKKIEKLEEWIASLLTEKERLFKSAIDAYDRQSYKECIELLHSMPVDASDSSPRELESLASQKLEKLNTLVSEVESNLNRGNNEAARKLIDEGFSVQASNARLIEFAEREAKSSEHKYQTMLQQAEGLQKAHLFQEATRICDFLSQIKDARFEKYRFESMQLKEQINADEKSLQTEQQRRISDALEYLEKFRYKAAIARLEWIPEVTRTEECELLLASLKSDLDESRVLLDAIKNQVKSGRTRLPQDIVDLLELVDRALHLRGDRKDLIQMREQLKERLQKTQVDSVKFERKAAKTELVRFNCPNCSEKLNERLELLARQEECPACGSRFHLTDQCWEKVLSRRQQ